MSNTGNQGCASPDERRQNKRLSQQEYREHEADLLSQLAERVPHRPTRRGDILQQATQWIDTLRSENQSLRRRVKDLERSVSNAIPYPHSQESAAAMNQVYSDPGQTNQWNIGHDMQAPGILSGHGFVTTDFQGGMMNIPSYQQNEWTIPQTSLDQFDLSLPGGSQYDPYGYSRGLF